MCQPVEQCGCHLGIAEDARPFTEGEVCCDDDRGSLVELADQVEQQLAAGLGEGQVSKLVQDQEVEAGDQISGSALPFSAGFSVKFVHEINTVEEPSAAATPNAGPFILNLCDRTRAVPRENCFLHEYKYLAYLFLTTPE